jgi:hypothetical protein
VTRCSESERALSELQEVGRQAAATLAEQEQAYRLWQRSRVALTDRIQEFLNAVGHIDVSNWTEDHFVSADKIMGIVVDAIERYLAIHVDQDDTSQLHFLGEAIRTLREARKWIVQGVSPDAAKRPTAEERERLATECAERALQYLLKDA